METQEKWLVEYNGSQNRFHVANLVTRLLDNKYQAIKKEMSGWYAIAICSSTSEASELIRSMELSQTRNSNE
jgi:hypothetical protein